ncbi:M48 family metallopeptidase [Streptomyces melanogenes]|uniref:M48 family metallopeptidase n=1 Tax=Streptomyces melanogenes TaxID=67326 RepID=UPI0037B49EC6
MTDDIQDSVPSRQRRRFPGISSRAYEHPADRSALVALRKLSGFDTVFKALSGLLPERSLRLLFLSDSVRVSDAQFAHLNAMLRDACYILDLEKVPPMYVTQDPRPNAMCIGLDEPIIVVTTGLVELLDEEEMRAVVGHEVGHALSGHSVYRTILLFLTNLALKIAWIPLGNVAVMAIVTALREWFRKSELSADRAGLLVGQDLQASMRGLMKIAGGNHLHEMNVDAFLEQAEEYEAGGDLRDSVLKILNVLPRSHPFTTVRAAELKKWAASRDYQRLMDGHYPRREEDKDTSVSDSFRESAASYAETVRTSKDPLMKLVGDIAGGTADLGGKLYGKFTGAGSASRASDRPADGGPSNGAKGGPQDGPSGPAADGDGPQDEPGRDA